MNIKYIYKYIKCHIYFDNTTFNAFRLDHLRLLQQLLCVKMSKCLSLSNPRIDKLVSL